MLPTTSSSLITSLSSLIAVCKTSLKSPYLMPDFFLSVSNFLKNAPKSLTGADENGLNSKNSDQDFGSIVVRSAGRKLTSPRRMADLTKTVWRSLYESTSIANRTFEIQSMLKYLVIILMSTSLPVFRLMPSKFSMKFLVVFSR